MPKENKRRGRREEKKRKHYEEPEIHEDSKRVKLQDDHWEQDEIKLDGERFGYHDDSYAPIDNGQSVQEFFGLLDEEEQSYFKRAAQMLDLNEFASGTSEERDIFIAGVWKECQGKELKVACSQSVSKLMEKLIKYATGTQLKTLFQSFGGHFLYLIQHRFASHCCEELFRRAAPLVTEELLTPFEVVTVENQSNAVSMESLFLSAISELEGNFGYLMTDQFASHTVRILLLILSGRPLNNSSTQLILQSKKKKPKQHSGQDVGTDSRPVPASFQEALDNVIYATIGELDTSHLRGLAVNPVGSPVLQLLLEIEFSSAAKSKQNEASLSNRLLPDFLTSQDPDNAKYIRSLTFDPIGSHLLETIIRYSPGKVFKRIWIGELSQSVDAMARNSTAIHILARVIERLSPEDLETTSKQILSGVSDLLSRGNYTIISLLIERMLVRKLDITQISDAVADHYAQSNLVQILTRQTDTSDTKEQQVPGENDKVASRQHLSVFFQSMLEYQGCMRKLLLDAFTNMSSEELSTIAKDKYATFTLQKSLAVGDKIHRRMLVQKLCPDAVELALHETGSHLLDSIWKATADLQFLRERIANQLALHEAEIRDSHSGRFVWRSWMMDLFTRRKQSWIEKTKQADSLAGLHTDPITETRSANEPKTGIAAARERFAARKKSVKSGVNAGRVSRPTLTA